MIEVTKNLFVGDGLSSVARIGDPDWFVISAAKEPWHRDALKYTERGAPRDHPEYLIARRPGHLILNLVDVADVAYVSPEIINAAIEAINTNIEDRKVLVHCNLGHSRSPTIAMLFMGRSGALPDDHDDAVVQFKTIYPDYAPAKGMADYARTHWSDRP